MDKGKLTAEWCLESAEDFQRAADRTGAVEPRRAAEALRIAARVLGEEAEEKLAEVIEPWAMARAECDPGTEEIREEAHAKAQAVLSYLRGEG